MISILILLAGLIGLWMATDRIVKSATALASHYHLKESFVGLSILAFGTDLPELAVMLDASLFRVPESSGIILGSAIGSAIGQISFVLGAVGLMGTLYLSRKDTFYHGSILCFSILFLFAFSLDGEVSRLEDGILFLGYFLYIWRLFRERRDALVGTDSSVNISILRAWIYIASCGHPYFTIWNICNVPVWARALLGRNYGPQSWLSCNVRRSTTQSFQCEPV